MNNWDDMRFFLVLSRTQSFVAAGRALKVAHSTVSRRLSALEASLQTQLFSRTEKGCRLTPAGKKLLQYAEQLETTVIRLKEDVAGRNHQLSGTVCIGAPDGFGNCFLAPRLGRFQRINPALEVELIAVPMYYSLAKREIDILITISKPTSDNIVARKLPPLKIGMFATRKYLEESSPIRGREDLRSHRMIGFIDDLIYDENLKWMNQYLPDIRTRFRTSTILGQKNWILADNGIGLLPYFMVHAEPSLVSVLPELISIERTLWVQVHGDNRRIARVRAAIDFIIKEMESSQLILSEIPLAGK